MLTTVVGVSKRNKQSVSNIKSGLPISNKLIASNLSRSLYVREAPELPNALSRFLKDLCRNWIDIIGQMNWLCSLTTQRSGRFHESAAMRGAMLM